MNSVACGAFALVSLALVIFAQPAAADYAGSVQKEDVKGVFKAPGYSPYAGRNFPTQVYWGDTHLHTNNSLDARAFGVTLGPEDAYRFARGEEITTSHGERIKLSRPLDWLVVTDHSDAMGAMKEIVAGNPNPRRSGIHHKKGLRVQGTRRCQSSSSMTTTG